MAPAHNEASLCQMVVWARGWGSGGADLMGVGLGVARGD
jgi:hypothetical protein